MNKRQKKKAGVIIPKKIKDLVRTYSELHQNQDELGGTFLYVGLEDFEDVAMPKIICTLTDKTSSKFYSDCSVLYEYVNRLVGALFTEYSCGFVENCRNYRVVSKIETRVEFVKQALPLVSYYVHQIGFDDNYSGTIYIPLRNKKFLAYDFTC